MIQIKKNCVNFWFSIRNDFTVTKKLFRNIWPFFIHFDFKQCKNIPWTKSACYIYWIANKINSMRIRLLHLMMCDGHMYEWQTCIFFFRYFSNKSKPGQHCYLNSSKNTRQTFQEHTKLYHVLCIRLSKRMREELHVISRYLNSNKVNQLTIGYWYLRGFFARGVAMYMIINTIYVHSVLVIQREIALNFVIDYGKLLFS